MIERRVILAVLTLLAATVPAGAGVDRVRPDEYAPYPAPDRGHVTDLAGLLSDEEEEHIEDWLAEAERRTGVEIVVVTVGSIRDYPATDSRSIEDFAAGLFKAHEVGRLPECDGVLFLVARADRKFRIVWGTGYGNLPEGAVRTIRDRHIVPCFKQGDYAGGIERGVKALIHEFAGVRVSTGINWTLVILLSIAAAGALVSIDLFRSGKRGWGWVVAGVVIIVTLVVVQVLVAIFRSSGRGRRYYGWGSGGGGIGGGGFSVGGGVTGSW